MSIDPKTLYSMEDDTYIDETYQELCKSNNEIFWYEGRLQNFLDKCKLLIINIILRNRNTADEILKSQIQSLLNQLIDLSQDLTEHWDKKEEKTKKNQ